MKEVWFAGTHSDIGGGNKANRDLNRGGEPLKWMMEEAQHQGLDVEIHNVKIGIPTAEVTGSLGGIWWLLEMMPIMRRAANSHGDIRISRTPHRGKARNVLPGHNIHWSVRASSNEQSRNLAKDLSQTPYHPKAKLRRRNPGSAVRDKDAILDWDEMFRISVANRDEKGPSTPGWEGEQFLMDAVDLVKRHQRNREADRKWFEDLFQYVTKSGGKPETIWTYGGPRLLHDVVAQYPDQQENARTIVRTVLGFTYARIDPKSQVKQPKQPAAGGSTPGETAPKPISSNSTPPHQIKSFVIPRVRTVLNQWLYPDLEANPRIGLESTIRLDRFRSRFRASETTDKPNPMEVHWGIQSISTELRSIRFVQVLIDVGVEIAKLDLVNDTDDVIDDLSRLVLGLLPKQAVIPAEGEEGVTEVIVNGIAKLSAHSAAKYVFYMRDAVPKLVPLLDIRATYPKQSSGGWDKYPNLVAKAVAAMGALGTDERCASEISEIPQIFTTLLELISGSDQVEDQGKRQVLAKEAMTTTLQLAQNYYNRRMLLSQNAGPKLIETLRKKYSVKDTLRVMALLSADTGDIDALTSNMSDHPDASVVLAHIVVNADIRQALVKPDTTTQVAKLLRDKDTQQMQAAANLVKVLFNYDELRPALVGSEIAPALGSLLKSSSKDLTRTGLDILMHIAPLSSEWVNSDLVDPLIRLSASGDKKATLAQAWTGVHNEKYRPNSKDSIARLVNMLTGEDDQSLVEQAITVLTKIAEQGFGREEMHSEYVFWDLNKVLRCAKRVKYYTTPDTPDKSIAITLKAFEMVKVLAVDHTDRAELIESGILKTVMALTDSPFSFIVDTQAEATLGVLKTHDDLREAINRIEEESDGDDDSDDSDDSDDDEDDDEDEDSDDSDLIRVKVYGGPV
ncbi:hypothetical protein FRC06_006660 [Ceratobasidium sp. 370]|nr:hypothetical protein FRC06_006660 [Ceratobasidium sp. 370]